MSDEYSDSYRQIMGIFYDHVINKSDIVETYSETEDKIHLKTKYGKVFEVEKNTYGHIDDIIERIRNKIRLQFSNYRRAVMHYLSKEDDESDAPLHEVRKAATALLTDQEILKELISKKKEGKLYLIIDKFGEEDNQVFYDLSNDLSNINKTMDEQLIEGEAILIKEIKKKMVAKKTAVSDLKFKQFLFKTLEECNAYPSKTNNALSKEDMVKIIQDSMDKGSYKNMPKGYKSKSKKEICRLLFQFND